MSNTIEALVQNCLSVLNTLVSTTDIGVEGTYYRNSLRGLLDADIELEMLEPYVSTVAGVQYVLETWIDTTSPTSLEGVFELLDDLLMTSDALMSLSSAIDSENPQRFLESLFANTLAKIHPFTTTGLCLLGVIEPTRFNGRVLPSGPGVASAGLYPLGANARFRAERLTKLLSDPVSGSKSMLQRVHFGVHPLYLAERMVAPAILEALSLTGAQVRLAIPISVSQNFDGLEKSGLAYKVSGRFGGLPQDISFVLELCRHSDGGFGVLIQTPGGADLTAALDGDGWRADLELKSPPPVLAVGPFGVLVDSGFEDATLELGLERVLDIGEAPTSFGVDGTFTLDFLNPRFSASLEQGTPRLEVSTDVELSLG